MKWRVAGCIFITILQIQIFFSWKEKIQNYSNAFLKNKSRPWAFKGLNPHGNREMLVSNVYFNNKKTKRL